MDVSPGGPAQAADAVGPTADAGVVASLEVDRVDLRRTRVVGAGLRAPRDGEVLFEVERFGFSANNVTYARLGESLRYWDLFPASPGWGQIPVWGYLRVHSSGVPGVDAGRRAFGLCPMATHVLLRPERVRPATFAEGSPHRSALSSVYNVYTWADAGPEPSTARDDAVLVLRPLFWLSFTLDDYLARPGGRAAAVIVTSASSKAAIGLAHLLSGRGVPVTGLTSPSRVAFVAGLALYDRVLAYDEIGLLGGPAGTVLVDIAGHAALRDRVDRRLAGRLAEIVVAGSTHREADRGAADREADRGAAESAGQRTRLFFAPDQIRGRSAEWGWPLLEQRFGCALRQFADSSSWLQIVRSRGLDGAADVYRQVLGDAATPASAHIVDMKAGDARDPR